jgi:pyridoxal phosphate enzyme (YggS family)
LPLRLAHLQQVVAATLADSGRTADSITVVAVSKTHAASAIRAAADLGLRHFGENYLQEALGKLAVLGRRDLVWHYIGRLQANKTRAVAEHFDWVHAIDRLHIAERLSSQRPADAAPLNICLQVNVAADPNKAGVTAAEAVALAQGVAPLPRLRLRGLMCMLPEALDATARHRAFAAMRLLLQQLREQHPSMDTLSMGMSSDYVEALAEGATMLRIGTAIFGARA